MSSLQSGIQILNVVKSGCGFGASPAMMMKVNKKINHHFAFMSLKRIPSSHCNLIKELASLSGLDITEYGGYNTFIYHSPGNMDRQE